MDPPSTSAATRKGTGSLATKPAIPKKPTLVIPKRTAPLPPKQIDNSEQNIHVVNIPSDHDNEEESNINSTKSESVILINSPSINAGSSGSVSDKRAPPKIAPKLHPKPRPKSLPKNLESSSPFGKPVNHDEILKDLVFTPQERLQKQKSLTNLDLQFEKFFVRNNTISTEANKISKEGILTKQGHRVKNWKQRYFVLEGFFLKYYKRKGETDPQGVIPLKGCKIERIKSDKKFLFELVSRSSDAKND